MRGKPPRFLNSIRKVTVGFRQRFFCVMARRFCKLLGVDGNVSNVEYAPRMSLENLSDAELTDAWFDEAERRANEINQGVVQLMPAEEVSAKANALLK